MKKRVRFRLPLEPPFFLFPRKLKCFRDPSQPAVSLARQKMSYYRSPEPKKKEEKMRECVRGERPIIISEEGFHVREKKGLEVRGKPTIFPGRLIKAEVRGFHSGM